MTHDVETREGRDFCSALMDVDEAFGIKASFQIVPERRYDVSREFLASIRQRGFEINVQDLNHDGLLYRNCDEFRRRVRRIHKYARAYGARGFRSAVLYRKPDWYEAFEFDYDMSIPNVAHLDPQRGGCCTVMPYFIRGLVELPVTTTQDYTIFHILHECSIDLWKAQIELIMGKNGLMSFIVHPDYVVKASAGRLYKQLLGYLCQLRETTSLWFALPGDVERWWRARNKMKLVNHGDRWRIEGEKSEQAVVAYATEANGRLVYRIESCGNGTR
jgi:hypothetical protein